MRLRGFYKRLGAIGCPHVVAATVIVGVALPGAAPPDVNGSNATQPVFDRSSAAQRAVQEDLARHWAPTFYHDTDDSYYVGDYITNFDFDGDYKGRNNWENLDHRRSVPAYVYFAVSETDTHYFLNYSVFHPRDWHEWLEPDMHENDFEGVSLVLRKDGAYGVPVAMETLAHNDFWQYGGDGIEPGTQDLEGPIPRDRDGRPRVFVEAKGHGIYGCDERCDSAPDGDGIVYAFGDRADSPASGAGNYTSRYSYALIALDSDGSNDGHEGFWHRRNDICDDCTFGSWGKLRGDTHGTDRANMPWVWHGGNKRPSRGGDMLCDPAFFFDAHLNGPAFDYGFSHHYVSHAFRTQTTLVGDTTAASAFVPEISYRPQAARFGDELHERSICRPGAVAEPLRISRNASQ
ncbi:MAG TPA: hypothetical protein VM686_02295 [Polyangiaceae bacterium]|nr:hypothetical protein [Polyangiaceae bacterium]